MSNEGAFPLVVWMCLGVVFGSLCAKIGKMADRIEAIEAKIEHAKHTKSVFIQGLELTP